MLNIITACRGQSVADLQGVLGGKQSEAGGALEGLTQLWNENLCPMVQHGIQALQDTLACALSRHEQRVRLVLQT